jgi:protein TonB
VVLRLFIDEHGRLLNVEIVEKAGYGFDEAAIEAVKASSFQPARVNGLPVACRAVLPVRFRLE